MRPWKSSWVWTLVMQIFLQVFFQNNLVTKKPTKEEFSALYDQYQEMVDDLKGKNNVHVFSHS